MKPDKWKLDSTISATVNASINTYKSLPRDSIRTPSSETIHGRQKGMSLGFQAQTTFAASAETGKIYQFGTINARDAYFGW
jgi:hypothetical protein